MLLTETWANDIYDLAVDKFEHFILNRTENVISSKRSSGGLVVYIRSKFVTSDTLVFHSEDDIICVKIKGDILGLQNDLFLCLCYVIPENSSRQAMLNSHTFERLLDFIVSLDSRYENGLNFILCGDLNSHTSNSPDFVSDDNLSNIDILPEDYSADISLTRYSQDSGRLNNNGRMLLDLCKQTGLRIMNGRVGNDKNLGRYTYVGSRGSSVVDYVISTQNLFRNVESFTVHDPNILSDHCLVEFSLSFSRPVLNNVDLDLQNTNLYDRVEHKYVWDKNKLLNYQERLSAEDTVHELNNFKENVISSSCNSDIDKCVNELASVIDGVVSPLFKRDLGVNVSSTDNSHGNINKWYNSECEEKRRLFYAALNLYRHEKTEQNRTNMVSKRSEYKNCIRKARLDYDRIETQKLLSVRAKNCEIVLENAKKLLWYKRS